LLFFLSEVLDDGCQISPHVCTFMLSFIQLIAISLYLFYNGYDVRDVSSQAKSLIAVRSIIYCVSFAAFVYSLRGLNPISALLALHSGLICMTLIMRLCYLRELFVNLTMGKMWLTVFFLTFAFYPGLSVVDEADFEDARYPIRLYWQFAGISFCSGLLLAIINNLTHKLASCGMLRHEAQMNFWQNLFTVLLVPIFITMDINLKEKRKPTKETCYSLFESEILLALFAFYLLKNVWLERSIMKRFVED
jgi:hypothetical protein